VNFVESPKTSLNLFPSSFNFVFGRRRKKKKKGPESENKGVGGP
jgi:hypothetical protein